MLLLKSIMYVSNYVVPLKQAWEVVMGASRNENESQWTSKHIICNWNFGIKSFISVQKCLCASFVLPYGSVVGAQPRRMELEVESKTARCQCQPNSAGLPSLARPIVRPEGVHSWPIVVVARTKSWGSTSPGSRILFPPSHPLNIVVLYISCVCTLLGASRPFLLYKTTPKS